jgi:hypothetical protein
MSASKNHVTATEITVEFIKIKACFLLSSFVSLLQGMESIGWKRTRRWRLNPARTRFVALQCKSHKLLPK